MAQKIGDMYIELGLNAKGFLNGVRTVDQKTLAFRKNMGIAFAAIGAAAMAMSYGVIRAVKNVVTAYSQQEKAETSLRQVLHATGEAVGHNVESMKKMSDALASVTAFSKPVLTETQAILATFTQIGKDVFPMALEQVANMATIFGQDLQKSAIQLGTALNDPIRGVTRLRRVGISFSETQKEMIRNFVETGDKVGAQMVIMEELQREIGGVARAYATTTEGAMKRWHNALEEARIEIGGRLAPAIGDLATVMQKTVSIMVDQIDILIPELSILKGKEDEVGEAGAKMGFTIARVMYSMAQGVTRLKITWHSLVAAANWTAKWLVKSFTWSFNMMLKSVDKFAGVMDKVFKTDLQKYTQNWAIGLDEVDKQFQYTIDNAIMAAEDLIETLDAQNDAEVQGMQKLIEYYKKLKEEREKYKGKGIGAPVTTAPGGEKPPGGEGGKEEPTGALGMTEEELDKMAEKERALLIDPLGRFTALGNKVDETKKKTLDFKDAFNRLGMVMADVLSRGELDMKKFLNVALQTAASFIPGGGLFGNALQGLLGGLRFGKGGALLGAASGLAIKVNQPTVINNRLLAGEEHKSEWVLTPQLMSEVFKAAQPQYQIINNGFPEDVFIRKVEKLSPGGRRKLAAMLTEEVLPLIDRLDA